MSSMCLFKIVTSRYVSFAGHCKCCHHAAGPQRLLFQGAVFVAGLQAGNACQILGLMRDAAGDRTSQPSNTFKKCSRRLRLRCLVAPRAPAPAPSGLQPEPLALRLLSRIALRIHTIIYDAFATLSQRNDARHSRSIPAAENTTTLKRCCADDLLVQSRAPSTCSPCPSSVIQALSQA